MVNGLACTNSISFNYTIVLFTQIIYNILHVVIILILLCFTYFSSAAVALADKCSEAMQTLRNAFENTLSLFQQMQTTQQTLAEETPREEIDKTSTLLDQFQAMFAAMQEVRVIFRNVHGWIEDV